ncbi:hypothetical protein Tco_0794546 [Tanacetum coccineum]
MTNLEFVDQHNMVACLEKTGGNSKFHEIVDFLTSSLIHHALTVSPTIYISYIEQFWNTASSQTVNDEKQIHATVDSKAVVVTEASIRSSLLLHDADGTACLTNEAIFQNLALMGYEGELNKLTFQKALFSPQWKYLIHTILHCLSSKSTSWNEFSTNIASAVICLATNQKFNFSKLIFDGMLRNLDTSKKKFLMYPRFLMVFLNNQIELGEPFNDVYVTPAHTQKVFSNMSRKGVKFSGKVTPLFDFMLVPHQAPEGEGSEQPTEPQPTPSPTQPSTGDQPPVTASSSSHDTTQDSRDSLEHYRSGPTSDRAEGGMTLEELYVLCTNLSNRVLALEASKDAQAAEIIKLKTKIKKIKKKSDPVILHHRAWLKSVSRLSMKRKLGRMESVSKQGRKNAKSRSTLDAFDDLDADLPHGMEYIDTEEALNKKGRSTVITPPITTRLFDMKACPNGFKLDKEKEEKAKEKGNKGKSVLEEPEPAKKMSKSDFDAAQIARDAEIARKLQADLQAEVERERQREELASKVAIAEMYNEVQAGIDADALFVVKLQQEEREEYTIEEREKFLAETIAAQRKFRVAQRSAEIRSRPPTKSQLRNLMMTYLKNMGGYKHSQLKAKSFKEIKGMYERQKKSVQDFIPIGFAEEENLIKKMNEKATGEDTSNKEKVLEEPDSTKVEVKKEGNTESTRKGLGRKLKMKATKKSKRQKTYSDLDEEEQLKAFLVIVPDEEGEINYEVLNRRYPIVNWESKFYHTDRYGKPHNYYRVFRADGSSRHIKTFTEMVLSLRTMFEANVEDVLWKNQEEWILESWNFYDNYGVHILVLEDGTEFYMLAERRFPLKKETLERMLALRLIAKSESEAAPFYCNEALAIPEQMATGKEISNPFMAGSLPKNYKAILVGVAV